jgi:hypothetical protein
MREKSYKPPLDVVRQAAWRLATLLVEQADFTQEDMIHTRLNDLTILNQEHGDESLRYALRGLISFGIDTKIPNQGRLWAPLFISVVNLGPGDAIEAVLNPCRHPELRALKQNITLLRHQDALTTEKLTQVMKSVNPSVRYEMTLKKLPPGFIEY